MDELVGQIGIKVKKLGRVESSELLESFSELVTSDVGSGPEIHKVTIHVLDLRVSLSREAQLGIVLVMKVGDLVQTLPTTEIEIIGIPT